MSNPSPPPDPRPDDADRVRGRLMHASLKALLDRVPGSRHALPHLAALENSLGQRGAGAIEAIAPHWRARIHAQLASMPRADDDAPLQDLLARVARPAGSGRSAAPAAGGFEFERTVVIQEISHSEFMAVAAAQAGSAGPAA